MKKSLLALAAMGAFTGAAQAQSSVTVYGILDVGYINQSTKTTNSSGAESTINLSSTGKTSSYTSSRLGFRGTEDLGKGLRAGFVYELGIAQNDAAQTPSSNNATTNIDSNFGNNMNPFVLRLANVSLSGAFGSITLGRQQTAIDTVWGVGDIGGGNNFIGRAYNFAPSIGAATTGYSASKQNNDRSDRLITYTTPNMSGFTASVQYGDGKSEISTLTSTNKQTEIGAALNYSAGPVQVALGYSSRKATLNDVNVISQQPTQMVLGANYDFKVAKVFALATTGSNKTAADVINNKRDMYELGVSVPVGALVLNASALTGTITPVDGGTSGNLTGMQIGALYNLSKRTMAYGVYGQDKVSGLATTNVYEAVERKNFGIGVRHTF